MDRRKFLERGAALTLGAAAAPLHAQGAAWPARAVRIMVPFPGGSAPDVIIRHIGAQLSEKWKHPVIIDNRPGGSGVIGMNNLLTSPADDHTFGFVQGSAISIVPRTVKDVPYNVERDFVPVSLTIIAPLVIAVLADSPYKTPADLIAASRKAPESVEIADTGRYSYPHLAAEFMGLNANTKFLHVHFQGGPAAIQSTLGGHTKAVIEGTGPLMPQVQSGKMRLLGSFGNVVYPGLEGVPLIKDAAPNTVIDGWFAMIARKGSSAAVVQQLNADLNAMLADPKVLRAVREQTLVSHSGPPSDLRDYINSENRKWAAVLDKIGAKPE